VKNNSYDYDVIIVGAGPAGSTTARYIKSEDNDIRVLILDKRKEVGIPIQCGEGLSKISEWKTIMPNGYPLEELFNIPKNVIAQDIKYIDMISPYQNSYRLNYNGWILYRDLFDQHLAELAISQGSELRLNTSVKGLKDKHTVLTSNGAVTGDIIVGADGPRSIIAKSCGLKTPSDLYFLCPSVVSIVKGNFYDNTKRVYFGRRYAGGFAWVFPKGDTANIGIGCELKYGIPLRKILNNFLKDIGVSSKDVLCHSGGLIPLGGPIPQTVNDNVLVVGDAAGMVFPSTGGGIGPAMIAGRECGLAVANYLKKGSSLENYEISWRRIIERDFIRSLKEKNRYLWLTRHNILLETLLRLFGKYSFEIGGTYP
jgi:digeranylgeranylglycerophospholipid reductase